VDPCTTIEHYKQTAQMLMEGFMTARAILDKTGNICADHTISLCGLYWENRRQTSIRGITNHWEKKQVRSRQRQTDSNRVKRSRIIDMKLTPF